ncbi:MAG: PAS domain S-box protein [Desulfobacteraceae bacterium]|nr:PAS domain S-box protein [Desulfobacteraceae bacterium]MBU4054998.1 PAS domain S-box protein [Pseudomonadota bacterium]
MGNSEKPMGNLKNQKTRYADLYELVPEGYFSLDENNQIVQINLTGAKMLGLEHRRPLGLKFSNELHDRVVQ